MQRHSLHLVSVLLAWYTFTRQHIPQAPVPTEALAEVCLLYRHKRRFRAQGRQYGNILLPYAVFLNFFSHPLFYFGRWSYYDLITFFQLFYKQRLRSRFCL